MIPAQYSLIRYIPDPARNEPLNVGILVWSGSGIRLRLEPQAFAVSTRGLARKRGRSSSTRRATTRRSKIFGRTEGIPCSLQRGAPHDD
jgi:hypothetical protein